MKLSPSRILILLATCLLLTQTAHARTYFIEAGEDAQEKTFAALLNFGNGDTLHFGHGVFRFTSAILMNSLRGVTIRGEGRDNTILSFLNSGSADGFLLENMNGVRITGLTVIDTPGFAITVTKSSHIEMVGIRVMWSSADGTTDLEDPSTLNPACIPNLAQPGTPDNVNRSFGPLDPARVGLKDTPFAGFLPAGTPFDVLKDPTKQPAYTVSPPYVGKSSNGAYAIYPVQSNHILLDDVQAFGAADAGIYVGQSNNVEIKNSVARYNVAGYEIENTDEADMHHNLAECNTAGFLIFDLPGLAQYGERTRMYENVSQYNNLFNFAVPGVVADVPAGVGLLILGYDRMEIRDNLIQHHRTAGVVMASHELLNGSVQATTDLRMDLYPEGTFIFNNEFINNGYLPQEPEVDIVSFDADGNPSINDGHSSLLPALVMIKSIITPDPANGNLPGPHGAHIVWDGFLDKQPFSTNPEEPLNISEHGICGINGGYDSHVASSLADFGQSYDRDAFGKPDYINRPELKCRFNAYKFQHWGDPDHENGSWIDTDGDPNNFERNMPRFGLCIGEDNSFDPLTPAFMNFRDTDPTSQASYDLTPHRCSLGLLPQARVESFDSVRFAESGGSGDVAECTVPEDGSINMDAILGKCEARKLSQFNLFPNGDPRDGSAQGGVLYDLTTPLFSDYSKKYRVVFVPEGKQAQWKTGSTSEPNRTIEFPVGTVIAKTFTFPNGNNEAIVETRLLMHRGEPGESHWQGVPYVWADDGSDAILTPGGVQGVQARWDYPDRDTGKRLTGSTNAYLVPSAGQCGECHSNQDNLPGEAPIGPKVRLLNMPNAKGQNQLQEWISAGILEAPPEPLQISNGIATNAPRLPRYGVAGDTYHNIDGDFVTFADGNGHADIQARARAWLETNCAHCHNGKGRAGSTGLLLDVFRPVNLQYGVCKHPPAGGSGLGGYEVDILPLNASESIIPFRMQNTTTGEKMPPLGRSVAHTESLDLVRQWINSVVDRDYPGASKEGASTCDCTPRSAEKPAHAPVFLWPWERDPLSHTVRQ